MLCPSCLLPWESIELGCNWLKRVPFAHKSATHEFFPSHVPSYHFRVPFHMKNRDFALLKKEKSLHFKSSDTSHAISSFISSQHSKSKKKKKNQTV